MLKIVKILPTIALYSSWARRLIHIGETLYVPNRLCKRIILIKVRPISSGLDCFYYISNVTSWPKTLVSDCFIGTFLTNCTYLIHMWDHTSTDCLTYITEYFFRRPHTYSLCTIPPLTTPAQATITCPTPVLYPFYFIPWLCWNPFLDLHIVLRFL